MTNDPARRRCAMAVLVIVAAVLVANLIRLTGSTPLDQRARLSSLGKPGPLPGQPTIDPNDGYTALALGHLAAEDWLHGHLPYWNPYEGVGTPLAGEMQSAAMFPLVPLLALPQGLLWMHVLLELLAALATWLLLRRLGLAETVATLGGILFAFNGTFGWLSNAAVNPIAFLPLLLVGIEAVRGGRRCGIVLTASAVALSLYAGFPEVAFLDTLFALGWAAIRLPARGARGRFAARCLLGGVLGVALAAPILIAFADYLRVGFTGDHAAGIGSASLEPIAVSALAVPYLFGPVYAFFFQDQRIAAFWGSVGGYLSSTSVVLALSALFSPRRRRLKLYLAVWSLLASLKIYGFPLVGRAIDLIPGIEATAFDRYAIVTVEFAVILLAVLALDDLNIRQLVIVGAGVAVVLVLLGVAALPVVRDAARGLAPGFGHVRPKIVWAASLSWAVGAVAALILAALLPWPGIRRAALLGVVGIDALALFVVPQFSQSATGPLDRAAVSFLQHHLGQQRFFTLGPVAPNFGSYFETAEININDAITPRSWSTYISHLDPGVNPLLFIGYAQGPVSETPAQAFLQNLSRYRAVGVKYLVESPGTVTSLPTAYQDPLVQILALPTPAPFFHTSCSGSGWTQTRIVLHCSARGTVVRLEQFLPGWKAKVNGRTVPIRPAGPLFQQISVPAGTVSVVFRYDPPFIWLGWAVALIALAACPLAMAIRR